MINHRNEIMNMSKIKNQVKSAGFLIHCITNHIAINDCANAVLSIGARPIMAEHPLEVSEITAISDALAVNLGNINDSRMESILISGKVAHEKNIPCVIDLVGIGCSKLRFDYAVKFIQECKPDVIKGNISEIKAICGEKNDSRGIDAGNDDSKVSAPSRELLDAFVKFSQKTNSIIVATGAIDIISDGNSIFLLKNGCRKLSEITGTGCMLNCLIASYIASGYKLSGTILAVSMMNICGELSEKSVGNGSFRTALLDNLSTISDEVFSEKINFFKIEY